MRSYVGRCAALLATTVLGAVGVVNASTCVANSPEIAASKAAAVFRGRVVWRTPVVGWIEALWFGNTRCGAKVARLYVTRVWKGKVPKVVRIYSPDACSGLGAYLSWREEYLVYGHPPEPGVKADFAANSCSGTTEIQAGEPASTLRLLDDTFH